MRIIKVSDANPHDGQCKRRLSFSFLNRGRSIEQHARKLSPEKNRINNHSIPSEMNQSNARYLLDLTGPHPQNFKENINVSESLATKKRDRKSYSISRSANIQNNFNDTINKSRWSCFLEDFQNLISSNEKAKNGHEQASTASRLNRPSNLCLEDYSVARSFTRDSSITPTQNETKNISPYVCLLQSVPRDGLTTSCIVQSSDCDSLLGESMTLKSNSSFKSMSLAPNALSAISTNVSCRPKSANFDILDLENNGLMAQSMIDQGFHEEIRDAGKPCPPPPPYHSRRRNLRTNHQNTQNGQDQTKPWIPQQQQHHLQHPQAYNRPLSEHFNFDIYERSKTELLSARDAPYPREINNNNPGEIFRRNNSTHMTQSTMTTPGEARGYFRCLSEAPDYPSKYRGDITSSDWYSKLLPYKLTNSTTLKNSSTYSMNQDPESSDPSPPSCKPPTRRIPRQSLAQRNIMTQSMIAYIPDASPDDPNIFPNRNLNRFPRTISTDRYSSSLDMRPSLPSLAHLMGKDRVEHQPSSVTPTKDAKTPASPDFLRDQKSFLHDVEARADSPRLDQYCRLFQVRNGMDPAPQTPSKLAHDSNEDFECMTLRRKDLVVPVTKRPSRPTFVRI